ncbi:uncharacterized protein cracdla isoform X2 [Festucalex cinctus]
MEAFSVDTDDCADDASGPRTSRIKSLRSRLFVRSKQAGAKFSQSATDILAGKALESDEDLAYPHAILGSRALSHDSIFWADQVQTDDDDADADQPVRVLSQENVHSKIKALQMKLRQQKMHLGPPPLVLPIRRQEDDGGRSEEAFAPHQSPEFSTVAVPTHGTLSKVSPQPGSCPLSAIFKPPASRSGAAAATAAFAPSVAAVTSPHEPSLDFGAPAHFTPSLDTSAARHRMSVKPRNQRASTKRRLAQPDAKMDDMNNHPEPVTDELILEEQGGIVASQQSFPKSAQLETFPSEATQDGASPARLSPVSFQELQVKLQRRAKGMGDNSGDSGVEVKNLDRSEIVSICASAVSRSSPVCPQNEAEVDCVRGLKRPGSGSGSGSGSRSGSFHFSITSAKSRIEDRRRSGSFGGVVGQAGSRHKAAGPVEDITPTLRQTDERQERQTFAGAGLRQEQKSASLPRGRRDSARTAQSAKPRDAFPSEEVEGSREATKVEVKEEEGKTVFAFKLRSTSNSVRFWSDGSSGRQSRKASSEEQRQESPDNDSLSKNANAGDFTQTDSSPPSVFEAPTEVQTISSNQSQELQPTPPAASPEVSWVSLAMEKTRSLHQLFARRFPKDLTSSAPQTPAQAPNPGEVLNGKSQTARLQECEKSVRDGGEGETEPNGPFQKTTVNTWKEPEHVQTSQQTNVWTAQSPSRSASQFGVGTTVTQSLAQPCQTSDQHPPPWSHRGLQPASHPPKSATVQQKESPSLLAKRHVWPGSLSEKAAFLERQAECGSPPGIQGASASLMELRKVQPETKTSSEPLAQTKDTKPESREGFKLPESQSPIRVPDRPREEKWVRKNLGSSPSPSSSPILRSTADNAQPSWMELAKRKSMAWSDKTMD